MDNVGYLPSATVDRAYEQGERILSDQFYFRQESVSDAYLADHRRPPEEHDEHVIEVRSEEEPCRSRHASGDPGTSFDDPNDACWYSLLSAPEHTKPADQSVKKQLHNHCVSHFFSQDKYNVINGCLDEEFTRAAVELIMKFTTTAHKPFPKCLQDLFHKSLRHSSTFSEASYMYRILKIIQHLHHPNAQDLPIQWTHIKHLVTSLLTTPQCEDNRQYPLQWHMIMLSLCYLVTALEDDLERKARWNTIKKSSAYSILHPDNCRAHCRELMEWTHSLVSRCAGSSQDCTQRTCGCSEELCHRNHVLPLLVKLLELSLRLTNGWNYKEYVQRMAEELNSLGLVNLPQMQLMFEVTISKFPNNVPKQN